MAPTSTTDVVPTEDAVIDADDLIHLICLYDLPLDGPVTDPNVRAACGRSMLGHTYRVQGQICEECKLKTFERPTECPKTGQPCNC